MNDAEREVCYWNQDVVVLAATFGVGAGGLTS